MQIYLGVGVDANVALPKQASAHHGAPPTGVDANVALEWHNRRQVSATECR